MRNYILRIFTISLSCILCAGCGTIRNARNAQNASTLLPGEKTVTAAELGLNTNSVLNLTNAIKIALTYNPAVLQSRQSLVAASSQIRQATASYKPSISASAGYNRRASNSGAATASNDSSDSYSASLGLDILIYDFGKTPAAVKQAVLRGLAAEENVRGTQNDTVFAVRTAFFELAKAQELRQVREDAVRQSKAHLDQAKSFAEVGLRTRYDVTKADVDFGNAQLALTDAENALVSARAVLNLSIGLAEDPGFIIAPIPTQEVSGNALELMTLAKQHHPGLLVLRAQEQISSAGVDQTIADLYPALRLNTGYALAGSSFPLVWNWVASLQSSMELFTGSRKTAAIDIAVADLRAARSAVAAREQLIHLDLTRALSTRDTARHRLDLSEFIVRQAAETLELVNERYKQGKASSVDVTDAQTALTQAMADRVKARFDQQSATASIMHAIGDEQP
ncbi:MAG: TolC family protein [bacterium]